MILLIDNYDSFTYNLWQLISGLGYDVQVAKHDKISIEQIEALEPSHIVISPGPKRPQDSGVSLEVIRHFYDKTPLLGVCLGHQCLGEVFGASTVPAKQIVHGKTDAIFHSGRGLFVDLPSPFKVARYHSLMLSSVPRGFVKTAWTLDGTIMAIQHKSYPLYGVQFHPESFMTEYGVQLIGRFLS